MQALTPCDVEVVSTRTQQSVSSRASSRGRWRKCRRRFKMQTLTHCDAKITSTRTAVGQFKGQFKGAMERYMHMRGSWVRFGKTHVALPRHTANSEHTSGAMEETSGKVQNASTHTLRRRRHEHAHNSWSIQGPVQGGDGTLHIGSIRRKAHQLPEGT